MKLHTLAKSAAFAMAILTATQITFAESDTNPGNLNPEKNTTVAPAANEFHGPPPGHCHSSKDRQRHHEEMKKKFAQELNLTKKQQTQIEALQQAFFTTHKVEMKAHQAQFEEIRKLKESGASQTDIQAKILALPKPNFEAMKAEHDQLDAQINALLTPEQVKKFEALKLRHAKRHESKPGGPEGLPPPPPPEQ